tara:strand:+ start:4138 stop:5352 length:1215 start_codon:yes stop_codon:yes gene_type:complete
MVEIIGYIFIFIIAFLLLFEVIFKLIETFSQKISDDEDFDNERLKSFFPKNYHNYIDYYASWNNAMFNYDFTIGYRLINSKNKLSEKFAKINSLGFRSEEFEEKKDNDLVIIFSGASTAFGCGATSNEKTIPYQFKNKIAKMFPKRNIKVYNLSQINNYQTQEIILLTFFIKKLKPDIVISINGWNELIRNNFISDDSIKKYNIFNIAELEGWEPARVIKNKKKNFLTYLYLYLEDYSALVRGINVINPQLIFKRQKLMKLYRNFDQSISVGSDLYIKNFEILNKMSHAFNFKYFSFLQPNITNKKNLTEDEKKLIFYYKNYNRLFKEEDFIDKLYNIKNIYNYIHSMTKNKNYNNIFDLTSVFSNNNENIYCTPVHLNDIGQDILAKEIYDILNREKIFNEFI